MIQTLGMPLLLLIAPNIDELNDTNVDSFSCVWRAVSKCKDSLENAKRLENMSWRMWYRESIHKNITRESKKQQQQVDSNRVHLNATTLTSKPFITKSSTRLIRSLSKNEIVIIQPQQNRHYPTIVVQCEEPPQQRNSKFFIQEDNESDWIVSDYSDDDDDAYLEENMCNDDKQITLPYSIVAKDKPLFYAVHDEQDTDHEDKHHTIIDDEIVDKDQENDALLMTAGPYSRAGQSRACQLEFTKQILPLLPNNGFSLLSNMIQSQVAPDKSSEC